MTTNKKKPKARRGHGDGTIRPLKNGTYEGFVSLGYDSTGKRRRKPVYGASRAEVQLKMAELRLQEANTMQLAGKQDLTLAEFIALWLTTHVKPNLTTNTYIYYEGPLRNHVTPRLGHMRLDRLKPAQFSGLLAELARDGKSAALCQNIHSILKKVFSDAEKLGYVRTNPLAHLKRPKASPPEHRVLSPEELPRFLEAARGDRFNALYVLALSTGLRIGEILGLQWGDVDLKKGELHVRNNLIENKLEHGLGKTKTKGSRRRIRLTPGALKALRTHREAMLAEGNLGGFVFCTTKGTAVNRGNFYRRSFYRIRKEAGLGAKAGLPALRFHDLRHTVATYLLSENVHPKVVQEILGHSRVGTTLETYSHVSPIMHGDAMDLLEKTLDRHAGDWWSTGGAQG